VIAKSSWHHLKCFYLKFSCYSDVLQFWWQQHTQLNILEVFLSLLVSVWIKNMLCKLCIPYPFTPNLLVYLHCVYVCIWIKNHISVTQIPNIIIYPYDMTHSHTCSLLTNAAALALSYLISLTFFNMLDPNVNEPKTHPSIL
jgi:hypothetical protein